MNNWWFIIGYIAIAAVTLGALWDKGDGNTEGRALACIVIAATWPIWPLISLGYYAAKPFKKKED
jgi:hypothetical protein